jgi:hypothetical protein
MLIGFFKFIAKFNKTLNFLRSLFVEDVWIAKSVLFGFVVIKTAFFYKICACFFEFYQLYSVITLLIREPYKEIRL